MRTETAPYSGETVSAGGAGSTSTLPSQSLTASSQTNGALAGQADAARSNTVSALTEIAALPASAQPDPSAETSMAAGLNGTPSSLEATNPDRTGSIESPQNETQKGMVVAATGSAITTAATTEPEESDAEPNNLPVTAWLSTGESALSSAVSGQAAAQITAEQTSSQQISTAPIVAPLSVASSWNERTLFPMESTLPVASDRLHGGQFANSSSLTKGDAGNRSPVIAALPSARPPVSAPLPSFTFSKSTDPSLWRSSASPGIEFPQGPSVETLATAPTKHDAAGMDNLSPARSPQSVSRDSSSTSSTPTSSSPASPPATVPSSLSASGTSTSGTSVAPGSGAANNQGSSISQLSPAVELATIGSPAAAPASVAMLGVAGQPASGDSTAKSQGSSPSSPTSNSPGTTSPGIATANESVSSAATPVQMAQMVSRAAQTEMRIGLNTSAFGNVEVRTSVHANDVGVVIGSEKGDLRSLLASDLPAIANTLQQQNLRLQEVTFQQGFGFSANSSFGGNPQPRYFTPTQAPVFAQSAESSADEPAQSIEIASRTESNLSILA